MKQFKKAVAITLVAAMATSSAQFGSFGSIKAEAAEPISRVSVHDPSVFVDNGKYYVFGSHMATATSDDLVNWTQLSKDYENVDNNIIYGNSKELLAESFKWAGYDDGDCKGGYAVWAPDVIYNPNYVWEDGSKGAYMLYYSASSTWRRSCIGYMVSKTVDGGYQYGGTVVYSGFTNTGKPSYDGNSKRDTTYTNDYLPFNKLIADGTIDGDVSTWKCFNAKGEWNNNYAPNAIDPTLFFDQSGEHLYMVYGSWSGGLFILELDKETGEAIYPGKDGVEPTSGNFVDRYFGVHIAGGNHQSGEGPYIEYDKNTGYYWLYETYGGLTTTGGYNMRMFRSKNPFGPYLDPAGNEAQNSGVNCYKYGVKLIGNYQFYDQPGYRAAGHNSALITDDGKYYNFFHQRFLDPSVGEYHEVRVRQQFLNEDDWLVNAVYENRNETIQKYTKEDVVGTYEYVNHGNEEKSGSMRPTETVTLNEDGTVSGDKEGTWTMSDPADRDYTYVTLNVDNAIYKGVFFEQTNDNGVKTMTFTAIGNNNLAVWGSKFEASDDVIASKVAEQLDGLLPDATRDDIELPSTLSDASITWTSDNEAVLSNTGKVTAPSEDTEVTLVANITYGTATISKEIKVTVYDGPRIIAGYDFNNVDGSEIAPTNAAENKKNATLKGAATIVNDETRGEVLKIENTAGSKQVNYLSLPNDVFKDIDKSGYTVSMWVNVGEKTFIHSALFEADHVNDGDKTGNYPMTRIGANLIGRINADSYSDADPALNYGEFTGKWQLVTYTVDANGIKVFLNGNQIVYDKKDISKCFDSASTPIKNANHVMVGAGDIWGDEDCQDVLFDDVRIYDTALTNSEVSTLYDETKVSDKEEPEEPEKPEQKVKPIQEEEPAVEGMTKVYVKLDTEKYFDNAYVYATSDDEELNEVLGEYPGKAMAHIGNGWHSVNVPNSILFEEKEDETSNDSDEIKEKKVKKAKKDKDEESEEEISEDETEVADEEKTEEVTEEKSEEETVELTDETAVEETTDESKEVTDDSTEATEESTDETEEVTVVDEIKEVITTIKDVVKDAFLPMQAQAAEHQLFAEGIQISVNNGDSYKQENMNAAFTTVRPSDEELKQAELPLDPTEPEKPAEEPVQPKPTPRPAPSDYYYPPAPSNNESTSQPTPSTPAKTAAVAPATQQIADAQTPLSGETNIVAAAETEKKAAPVKSASKSTSKKTAAVSTETEDEISEEETEEVVEDAEVEEETTEVEEDTTEETTEVAEEETPLAAEESVAESSNSTLPIVVVILLVVVAAGAGFFFVRKKNS